MELNKLLEFIKNKESYGGNYNIMARDKKDTDRALTSKTLKEVMSEQAKNKNRAAGAYQIIPTTMELLMKRMNLTGDEKFDEAMQDRMAVELLRHRGLDKFNKGELTAEDFGNNLAKEWASLPLLSDIGKKKAGSSYYQGQHGNVALAGADEFGNIVKGITAPKGVEMSPADIRNYAAERDVRNYQGMEPGIKEFLKNAVERVVPPAQAGELDQMRQAQEARTQFAQQDPRRVDVKAEPQYATMEDLLMDKGLMNPLLSDDLAQRMWERF